ncbi:HNH endonuclease [Sporosarcina sp. 179-K 3D1 HS]|uniref:HNH endonuclease n=1 Tax=Sporosarcina sp. 179-K 3D1 HS TaxID=3232169 RepID=UPI0039A20F01
MEAHYLVPLSLQGDYSDDLDRVENIKSLCPNCHKAIYHAKDYCAHYHYYNVRENS